MNPRRNFLKKIFLIFISLLYCYFSYLLVSLLLVHATTYGKMELSIILNLNLKLPLYFLIFVPPLTAISYFFLSSSVALLQICVPKITGRFLEAPNQFASGFNPLDHLLNHTLLTYLLKLSCLFLILVFTSLHSRF